jgi:hypothetical protein
MSEPRCRSEGDAYGLKLRANQIKIRTAVTFVNTKRHCFLSFADSFPHFIVFAIYPSQGHGRNIIMSCPPRLKVLWFVAVTLLFACGDLLAIPSLPPFGVYPNQTFSPTVTVLESNSSRIRLDLVMNHLPATDTINFAQPQAGLWGDLNQDSILVPRFTIYLALAGNGTPAVSVDTVDTIAYPAIPRSVPYNNPPRPLVALGRIGILGGIRILPVTFSPLRYTNQADTCYVMHHAVVDIAIGADLGENPVSTAPIAFSRTWQRMLQSLVTNWEYIPNFRTTTPSHILMIVPDAGADSSFLTNIQPFVQWKEQRGFKVTVVGKSSIALNPSPQQIRARIMSEYYDSSPRIDFVILVGDETKLRPQMTQTSDPTTRFSTETFPGSYTNEMYFGAIEGTDAFPDVFLGRWVVHSPTDAAKIARRSVLYERDAFISDSLRFEKAVCAADMSELSQRLTVGHVRHMLLDHGFTRVDTMWGPNVGSQDLINDMADGRGFINYRGSGWSYGWVGIGFYVWNVSSLNNSRKLPIITGIGCGTGIYNNAGDPGLGEAFMLAGGVDTPTGAAAFIGPCWNTHTVLNDCLDSTLYRAWLDYDMLQLSPGLALGKMMTWGVLNQFLIDDDVDSISVTMMQQYHAQGDPSLQVYAGTPIHLDVTLPDTVASDTTDLTVTVNNMTLVATDSINVTAWMNDTNSVSTWIPRGQNTATLHLITIGSDTVFVTITGDSVLAFQRKIPVAPLAISPNRESLIPAQLELAQNYPNPFNLETTLEFGLPISGSVKMEVFDLLGRKVATLLNSDLAAGRHRVQWRGNTATGEIAGSGIYYCRLSTARGELVRKMLLVK